MQRFATRAIHIDVTLEPLLAELPDGALIRRFLDGGELSEAAFRALYHRHNPRLRITITRLLGKRRDEVDDVLQETWLAGCRGLHRFRGESLFSTWLTTIGVRKLRDRLRGDANEVELPADIPDSAPPPPVTVSTVIDLGRAIEQLSERQRMVLLLHDVEGFSHDEIAEQLDMAPGTSRAILSRARCVLRTLLHDGIAYAC
jgi:RNA polymerase sigma factor (sigma-70 family)